MIEVAILTPDPAHGDHAEVWPPVLARLQAALAVQGIRAVPTPWVEHVDDASGLHGFAHVLPLLVWNYHVDHARWLRACRTWDEAGLPMSNPPAVLSWNSDKRYLARLAGDGVAIPHTVWSRRLARAQLEQVFETTGADELIAKPTVSGGAWKTWRFGRDGIDAVLARFGQAADVGDGDDDAADIMVQPFLPTILDEGETSLLYFGGRARAGGAGPGRDRWAAAVCAHRHGAGRRRPLAADGSRADRTRLLPRGRSGPRRGVRAGAGRAAVARQRREAPTARKRGSGGP